MKTAENISSLRKRLKMTQTEFGEHIEVSKGCVCNYESGHRFPSFKTASLIVELALSRGVIITLEYVRPRQ